MHPAPRGTRLFQSGPDPSLKLDGDLIKRRATRGSTRHDHAVIQTERKQNSLFQPFMHHPAIFTGGCHAQTPGIQRLQSGFNRLAIITSRGGGNPVTGVPQSFNLSAESFFSHKTIPSDRMETGPGRNPRPAKRGRNHADRARSCQRGEADTCWQISAHADQSARISVPEPDAVNSSSRQACGVRPLMITAARAPA